MADLKGKVAFITGAARGQGRDLAVKLAEDGADIIAVDVCEDVDTMEYPMASSADLEETVLLVEAHDRRIVPKKIDVRDSSALDTALQEGVKELGRLDILCANAGGANYVRAEDMTDDQWSAVLDVCLTGVFNSVRSSIPHMRASGDGGAMVLTSSVYGTMGATNLAHYTAAKHGVIGLMKVLANELAEFGIRVNCIQPGAVLSGITDNEVVRRLFYPDRRPADVTRDDVGEILRSMNVLDEPWIYPRDISSAASWLVSDDARFVTGVTLPVDGGLLVKGH